MSLVTWDTVDSVTIARVIGPKKVVRSTSQRWKKSVTTMKPFSANAEEPENLKNRLLLATMELPVGPRPHHLLWLHHDGGMHDGLVT
jgi:hypothetical protein